MSQQSLLQPNQNIEALTAEVEQKLFADLVEQVKYNELTLGQAQMVAKNFTALLPAQNKTDLMNILQQLGQSFPSAQKMYIAYIKEEAQAQREQRLSDIEPLIKSGDMDTALRLLHNKEDNNE